MNTSNRTILTVAELNAEVNLLLNQGFPLLWVEGEISNLIRPSSGHLYFSLKDNKSQIRCAMFRNRNMKLNLNPENGMKVLVRGRVGLYEPRGDYQLIAEHMEDAGVGQLQREYEALKKKLSEAGLFDEEHKKELPEYPKCIGVITSPTGAAIRDILHVLNRRSPHTSVLIYPVAVQGDSSKIQIEMAIRRANTDKKCDVLILARGGGSIEDLWSFNDEQVAKSIYQSQIPIISGVGHEIDFTIADFVSDLRAPTPSAAAELVTADKEQLLTEVIQTSLWLQQKILSDIKAREQKLDWLTSRLELQKPSSRIEQQSQRLDELEVRLHQQINNILNTKGLNMRALISRLRSNTPINRIERNQQKLNFVADQIFHVMKSSLQTKRSSFEIQAATLDSVSPLKTLDRGYAIVKDNEKGNIISSTKNLTKNQKFIIKFKNGEVLAQLKKIK